MMMKYEYGFIPYPLITGVGEVKHDLRKTLMQIDVIERDFVSDVIKFLSKHGLLVNMDNYEIRFSKNDRRVMERREVIGKVGRYHMKPNGRYWGYNVWIVRKNEGS